MRFKERRLRLTLPALLIVVLLLLAGGCGRDESGPLFRDRFANPDSGWEVDSQEMFDKGYEEGEYFIEVYEEDWFIWSRPRQRFDDVAVEVEARQVDGTPEGHFGLLCRYQSPESFYYFGITNDGYYAIMLVIEGEAEVLTGEGFLPSDQIQPTGEEYQIRAVCDGDELILFVNESQIAAVTDDTLQRGDVGLGVGSGPEDSIRVHFDNFVVTGPEEE